jgi:hypothetical protein
LHPVDVTIPYALSVVKHKKHEASK